MEVSRDGLGRGARSFEMMMPWFCVTHAMLKTLTSVRVDRETRLTNGFCEIALGE